jgi:hypothetical protein
VTVKTIAGKVRRRARRSAAGRMVAAAARPRRAASAIRRSGLFDVGWYAEELGTPLPPGVDPIEHYVREGAAKGLSPNPCFLPRWYASKHRAARRTEHDPFTHYVMQGAARGDSPHPLFDGAGYLRRVPEARKHPGGALGHYLEKGWIDGISPHPAFDPDRYVRAHAEVDGPPFEHFARRCRRLWRDTKGFGHVERNVGRFDHAAAREFQRQVLAEHAASGGERPLVSIVVPTKDRATAVVRAIRSVLAQSYDNWQLIVVDDGSRDDTQEALAPLLADERIECVRRDTPGGVSAARNAGLARARGAYIAYLDSDNTWTPDFLRVMVAFVVTRRLRFAYAVSELVEKGKPGGRHLYRATPYDAGALLERNYIDCIVVLHERSLLDEVGGFDESLRRMVDWELFIRMSKRTEFTLAPFIATTYDPWEEERDRITISEPVGFFFVIKAKHMIDWASAEEGLRERVSGRASIVIQARGRCPPGPPRSRRG